MPDEANKLMFEYKRGTEYSVIVSIDTVSCHTTFHNIKFPNGTSKENKELFLKEADDAAITQLMKMDEDGTYPYQYSGD